MDVQILDLCKLVFSVLLNNSGFSSWLMVCARFLDIFEFGGLRRTIFTRLPGIGVLMLMFTRQESSFSIRFGELGLFELAADSSTSV